MTTPVSGDVGTPIPTPIPSAHTGAGLVDPQLPSTGESGYSSFDIAVGGLGFRYANSADEPALRTTAPFVREQVDQAQEAGEQTLTGWWMKSQSSFHGGVGQLNLEPAFPGKYDKIRYDMSKNVDVWTPGQAKRLPDTVRISNANNVIDLFGYVDATNGDCAVYLSTDGIIRRISVTGTLDTYTGLTGVKAMCTDGARVFAANATGVFELTGLATTRSLYTWGTAPTSMMLAWAKARLMATADARVYELDANIAAPVAVSATQLRYTHPEPGWRWTTMCEAPQAILAGGYSPGSSSLLSFTLNETGGVPTLTGGSVVATMPVGERILCATGAQANLLAVGTTAGLRSGEFSTLYGALTLGPLTVSGQPIADVTPRDRFVYAAGLAPDEGGLLRMDFGMQFDDGRNAWAPDIIGPDKPADPTMPARLVAALPLSGRLVFYSPGAGLMLEGVGPGNGREAWIRSSRVRYNTTEPKLFKLGRVRGDLSSGTVTTTALTPQGSRRVGVTGFVTSDPPEFGLPGGPLEWLQLRFDLSGASVILSGWGTKAIPGVPRQRMLTFVLACYENETDSAGHAVRVGRGSARKRLLALEALDSAGDEVMLEEFTRTGVIKTRVMIDKMQYKQTARPTLQSNSGGVVTLQLRTVT